MSSVCGRLKLTAADGKSYLSDVIDLILKKKISMVIDWSKIEKKEYLEAMEKSPIDINPIWNLLLNALTLNINGRETFMKGIDYSYYYEEIE